MRREVVVVMGAAALVTLMAIGPSGEVAAQTVMPGETGVDLTDARGQSGMNDAAEMKKEIPPDYPPYSMPDATIAWKAAGGDLVATVTVTEYFFGQYEQWEEPVQDAEVQLDLTLTDTGETWTYSGVTDRKGRVKFVHADAASGTYCGITNWSWWESYYTLE